MAPCTCTSHAPPDATELKPTGQLSPVKQPRRDNTPPSLRVYPEMLPALKKKKKKKRGAAGHSGLPHREKSRAVRWLSNVDVLLSLASRHILGRAYRTGSTNSGVEEHLSEYNTTVSYRLVTACLDFFLAELYLFEHI